MLVTQFTQQAIAYRRRCRELTERGFEQVSEDGDPLWKFIRGGWSHRHIEAVEIGPDRQSLWIKVSPEKKGLG